MMKRHVFIRCGLLALVTAGLALAFSTQTPAEDDYVVKLNIGGGLCEAASHMAVEKGFFAEEGVKYEIIKTSSATNILPELFASGKIDAGQMMLAHIGLQINNGFDFRIASGIHRGCLVIAVPADSDIDHVTKLQGKRIGVPGLGSTPMVITQRVLARNGIDAKVESGQVEFLAYNPSEVGLALKNGSVDAIAVIEPNASILVKEGLAKIIFDLGTDEQYQDEYCCVVTLNTKFAQEHPEVAARYVRAIQKGAKYVREHPEEAARIQIDNHIVAIGDLEMNTRLLNSYKYRGSVSQGREAFRTNLVDLQKLNLLNDDFDIEAIIKKYYIHLDGVEDEI